MIGCDETTARARPARLCPGGVRRGGRRDRRGHRLEGRGRERCPTTGQWAPITVTRPNVPVIGGGVPVDIDPDGAPGRPQPRRSLRCPARIATRSRSRTSRTSVPSTRSSGIRRPGCASSSCTGSTQGHCTLTGLKGFGGNQFPTVVLYPNISLRQARPEAAELHMPRGRRRRDDLVRHRQGVRRRLG